MFKPIRNLAVIFLMIISGSTLKAQYVTRGEANAYLKALDMKKPHGEQIALNLKLAEFNIQKYGTETDLDSADSFIKQAEILNTQIRSKEAEGDIMYFIASVADQRKEPAKQLFANSVQFLKSTKNTYRLALSELMLSRFYHSNIPEELGYKQRLLNQTIVHLTQISDLNQKHYGMTLLLYQYQIIEYADYKWKIGFLQKALALAKQIKLNLEISDELSIQKEIVLLRLREKDKTLSDIEIEEMLNKYRGKEGYLRGFIDLTEIYFMRGEDNRALSYSLRGVRGASSKDSYYLPESYMMISNIYLDQGKWEESITWLKKSLALVIDRNQTESIYVLVRQISSVLLLQGKSKESLTFVQDYKSRWKPASIAEKKYLAQALAQSYSALGQNALAEKYYLEMLKFSQLQISSFELTDDSITDYKLGLFYVSIGQYQKAEGYLKKSLRENQLAGGQYSHPVRKTYLALFKVDSAAGNYLSAIKNLKHAQMLNDTIFNIKKNQQIEELQVAYETDQKKKDIRLLQDKEKLQQLKLQQAETARNWIIAGSILLLIIVGLSYRQTRLKQKTNKLISDANHLLQNLVIEKEWLLKEVHHRVKNNLHTVICLLESQAAYLENDALKAIENSQHRIYAMSLIHQKLYQSEDIKTIDMGVYIPELVKYLEDSFDQADKIHFALDIGTIHLNISQAIPLGLIINEAVTNSIKYAFPGDNKGTVSIRMQENERIVSLELIDNGIGMPANIHEVELESLGLELMKGLTKDIKGDIKFETSDGTRILIQFYQEALSYHEDMLNV